MAIVTRVLDVAQPAPPTASGTRRRLRHFQGLLVAIAALGLLALAPPVSDGSPAATGPYSARVSWPAVRGAASVRIDLNGHLIDEVSGSSTGSYELHGLWPATTFTVQIEVLASRGRLLARYRRVVRTTRALGPFPRLYGPDAFINRPVPASPRLAPNSRAMVADALESRVQSANLSNDDRWGIPIAYADPQSARSAIRCTTYGCSFGISSVRIPAGTQPNTGSDHHLVVLQPNGMELDMWVGQRIGDAWSAGSRWVESADGPAANCLSTTRCSAADAAYFALGAGVVRPEEIAQGHIDHALALTTPLTRRGFVACPATHGDGRHSDPNALPIGAHLQLNPALDVAKLPIPRWQKVIAVALQRYGAYVVDTGGSISLYGQSNLGRGFDAWAKAGVPADSPSLIDLPWASMRVLAMTRCAS